MITPEQSKLNAQDIERALREYFSDVEAPWDRIAEWVAERDVIISAELDRCMARIKIKVDEIARRLT